VDVADLLTHLNAALSDRYVLDRELGRGGMATVYFGRDLRHRRPVALKILHPDLAFALGADRFLREIEVAANLTHPHILPLYESGEVDHLLYYVMPYIEGESLRERLRRETQLEVEDAVQIAREVADALAYAHGQGVVHRDIKPENILLYSGHALVADFGIARAVWQADEGRLTETGMAVGTAAYMSPEQGSGLEQVDGRSDVYSLGCVLYEMLAGEPPYTGPTAQAIIAKRLSDPVPRVRRVRPPVPDAVDQCLLKALAPVPADRFATAERFAQALGSGIANGMARGAVPAISMPDMATATGQGKRGWARWTVGAAVLLGVLVLAAIGVLVRRAPDSVVAGSTAGVAPTRLAVLPFENLGDTADAYFADGVTDAVRGKLVALPGLQVIARGSSNQYRGTRKTPQEIGRELMVQYLLVATVRWEKGRGEASRVLVTPELVQVASASTKWQHSFDAALTSVFEVQAEIAGRVAHALGVAFGDSIRRQLIEHPTKSLAAYDAYLKGQSLTGGDPAALRQAMDYLARAVALDSTFVQAWASLSVVHSQLYYMAAPTPAEARQARHAAERALALAPQSADGHLAMGIFHDNVTKDHARAADEFNRGQKASPNDARLLAASAISEQTLGRWEVGLTRLRQARILDPRSVGTAISLTRTLLRVRRYSEAQIAADQTLALAPTNLRALHTKAMISLAQGDLAGARAVLDPTPRNVDPAALLTYFAAYDDLYWVLTEAQQSLVLRLTPSAWDGDRATWGGVLAQLHWLRGDRVRARAYADSARITLEQQLDGSPDDAQRRVFLGLMHAYLGHQTDAVREGRRAVALLPAAKDGYLGPYIQHQLVRIYILVGQPDQALDQLEPLLRLPYFLSPDWVRIDPTFASLRDHPRFERLVNQRLLSSRAPVVQP
jgi:serine/threonine-protein kinase